MYLSLDIKLSASDNYGTANTGRRKDRSMSDVMMQAHRQYANRPADESFKTIADLVKSAEVQRTHSTEKNFNLRDLQAISRDVPRLTTDAPDGPHYRSELFLENRATGKPATFTHWAFGQFARMLGAPASYLRTLSTQLAADCLNYGIATAPHGSDVSLLLQAPNGNGATVPTIRAATSDSYSRVWDGPLYSAIQDTIVSKDSRWSLPKAWSGEPAGAYRGDRDSFVILTNGGSIVNDPSAAGKGSESGGMYRGIMMRNSEVGASSITIETILFRYICGNLMIWGGVMDRSFRKRHVGSKLLREVTREINQLAFSYANQSAARDEQIVRNLIDRQLAATEEGIIDELRKLGATKEQAIAAYQSCERNETASPRSFWGLAQGLTRISQEQAYMDGRYELDQLAAKLLTKGAKLIHA